MKTVYSGSPKMYTRTYELLEAITIKNLTVGHSAASFEIIIDPARIGLTPAGNGKWGQHMGMTGQDFREGLISGLEEGTSGSPYYNHPAHGFFAKTEKDLELNLVYELGEALESAGWEVTYS